MAKIDVVMTVRLSNTNTRAVALVVEKGLVNGLAVSAHPVSGSPDTFDVVASASSADASATVAALERLLSTVGALESPGR